MMFKEWREANVDDYNDREGIIRSKTVWSEEDSYSKIVELRLALKDAYEAGWNACADLNDSFTYDEVMSHTEENNNDV
jgi:hypothetical protein